MAEPANTPEMPLCLFLENNLPMRFITRLPITILVLISGLFIFLFGLISLLISGNKKPNDLEEKIAMETGKNIGLDFIESHKKLLDIVNFILWLIIITIIMRFILN